MPLANNTTGLLQKPTANQVKCNSTYLTQGKFLQEFRRLVSVAKFKLRWLRSDFDLGVAVFSSDQNLVRPEVIRIGVQSLKTDMRSKSFEGEYIHLSEKDCLWMFQIELDVETKA